LQGTVIEVFDGGPKMDGLQFYKSKDRVILGLRKTFLEIWSNHSGLQSLPVALTLEQPTAHATSTRCKVDS